MHESKLLDQKFTFEGEGKFTVEETTYAKETIDVSAKVDSMLSIRNNVENLRAQVCSMDTQRARAIENVSILAERYNKEVAMLTEMFEKTGQDGTSILEVLSSFDMDTILNCSEEQLERERVERDKKRKERLMKQQEELAKIQEEEAKDLSDDCPSFEETA